VNIGLSIMSALVDIITMQDEKRAMLDTQLKAARAKASKASQSRSPVNTKLETLKRDHDRVHDSVASLTNRVLALFDTIVVDRCRDSQASIRQHIVEAVGVWTEQCPAKFMKETYLKYLAWGMSDSVRYKLQIC
jgi:hypothetical protein